MHIGQLARDGRGSGQLASYASVGTSDLPDTPGAQIRVAGAMRERGGLPLYPCVWGLCGYNIYGLPPCGLVHTVV